MKCSVILVYSSSSSRLSNFAISGVRQFKVTRARIISHDKKNNNKDEAFGGFEVHATLTPAFVGLGMWDFSTTTGVAYLVSNQSSGRGDFGMQDACFDHVCIDVFVYLCNKKYHPEPKPVAVRSYKYEQIALRWRQ